MNKRKRISVTLRQFPCKSRNSRSNDEVLKESTSATKEVNPGKTVTHHHSAPSEKPYYPPEPPTKTPVGKPYPYGFEFAQAYIPVQPCNSAIYSPKEALAKGTLYPDLYRPYP